MTAFTQHELGQSYDIIREMQILWDQSEAVLLDEAETEHGPSDAYSRMSFMNNQMIGTYS